MHQTVFYYEWQRTSEAIVWSRGAQQSEGMGAPGLEWHRVEQAEEEMRTISAYWTATFEEYLPNPNKGSENVDLFREETKRFSATPTRIYLLAAYRNRALLPGWSLPC